jgi:hypothetical protein
MKIKWYGSDTYERFTGMQFSRVEGDNAQLGHSVDCKEIFADNFWRWATDKTFKILITRKVLQQPDPRPLNAERTQELLNLLEEEMGFPKSRVTLIEDVPEKDKPMTCILIESPTEWTRTSPFLHFYLLLVRNGSGHTPGKTWQQTLAKFRRVRAYQSSDRPQFIAINRVLDEIIKAKGKLPHISRASGTKEERMWHLGTGIVQYAHLRSSELKEATK